MNKESCCRELRIIPIPVQGDIKPGDDLAGKLLQALEHLGISLIADDILVLKHKIVSKSEGRLVDLEKIRPSSNSRKWARRYKLDPRVTELALRQSKRVVRRKQGV